MPDACPRVCIVGSVNMDLVVRAPRLPEPGETILGGEFERHPGGKGANQAVAAARAGAAVSIIAAVGDDDHGRVLRRTLDAEGIDLSHLAVRPGTPTGVGLISVGHEAGRHGAGENTIIVAPGANATLSPGDIDAARRAIAAADVLLMQLETPLDTVVRAATVAHEAGVTVILNAAPAAALPEELLTLVDVLVCNEVEAEALTSHLRVETEVFAAGPAVGADGGADDGDGWDLRPEPHDVALAKLCELGVPTVVLTLGARGAAYMHRDGGRDVPAYPVGPVDTVGAGDAFAGALAVRWAEHQASGGVGDLEVLDAVCWGCAAGGLATTRRGAIPSLPARADVLRLLATRAD